MRAHLAVLSLAVAFALTAGLEARGQAATDPHLRPADRSDAAFVADALQRSPTVRELADDLKQTDVIAYVTVAPTVRGEPDSSIRMAGRSRVQRFMVIKVNNALSRDRQVSLIGHELQHAVDMSRASWVTDSARMQSYLAMTGHRSQSTGSGFETLSALRTERKVGREVAAGEPVVGQGALKPR